jgi:hypothetical protein
MISPNDSNYESFAGAGRVKNVQIGFPVELTGTWDATTGYPWKRLMLSGVSVANASPIQMTGTNAVPIDGNTALTSGTKGWLEPDPGAAGYLFLTASTGGASYLAPVRVATTTAGTLATSFENGDTVDGVTLATGDRILIKDQSTASENGVYVVAASGAPSRASDADTGAELYGALVPVTNGTTNGDTLWMCTVNSVPTIGVSNLPWVRLSMSGTGTDNHIVRWNGTGSVQDSGATLTDGNRLTINQRANGSAPDGPGFEVTTGGSAVGAGTGLNGNGFVLRAAEGSAGSGGCQTVLLETYTEGRLGTLSFGVQYSYGDSVLAWIGSGLSGVFDSLFGFGVGGVPGVSGTTASGDTVVGGIITAIGLSSYVTEMGDNDFTGLNSFANTTTFTGSVVSESDATFTPADAATVPVTVQGAASQTANLTEWKNSGGTVLASVSAAGVLTASALNGTYDAGTW